MFLVLQFRHHWCNKISNPFLFNWFITITLIHDLYFLFIKSLVAELREDLDAASRRNAMERQNDEANFHQETINKVPLGIYIG